MKFLFALSFLTYILISVQGKEQTLSRHLERSRVIQSLNRNVVNEAANRRHLFVPQPPPGGGGSTEQLEQPELGLDRSNWSNWSNWYGSPGPTGPTGSPGSAGDTGNIPEIPGQ